MSPGLQKVAAMRRRQLLITRLPPHVEVIVYILMWWHKDDRSPREDSNISGPQGRIWLPMMSLEPPWKYASIDILHTLIRSPWGPWHHIDIPPPPQQVLSLLSRHIGWSNKSLRDCSNLKKRHVLTAAATHGRPLWNGFKLGKIVISKQA
jgi:hypothetical protein